MKRYFHFEINGKMKHILNIIIIIFLPYWLIPQTAADRPKIGLALSGGGAKGLAHIGLLKAIDSAGINVDYISGTSMGAIVGGLYAVGYSGKEIAEMAREMQWNRILSDRLDYHQLMLPFKEDSRQFLNIPLVDKKLHIGTGVLESNELWLWLSNHFSAYNRIVKFEELPRSFRCVATRLDNGEPVILTEGNLVQALRASMAIPSVFTSVHMGEVYLIDGGLVRNFPVSEVLDMGASITIGSSVTDQQLTNDDITNPMELISQIAFYSEKRDYREQLELTDIFVDYPITPYNAGSFSSAVDILNMGIERGREVFPILKNLKDSLDRIYGMEEYTPPLRQDHNMVRVDEIRASGLDESSYAFFKTQMDLRNNKEYTVGEISDRVRYTLASGIFKKITYNFEDATDSTVHLHLNFERDYQTYVRAGLGYSSETGLGIKLGLARSGGLSMFSRSSIGVSIGENQQFAARHIFPFGGAKSLILESSITGEFTDLNLHNQYLAQTGIFRQHHVSTEINLSKLWSRNFQVGIGSRWEWLTFNPEIRTPIQPKASNRFLNSHLVIKFNNQDKAFNPHRGNKINIEVGWNHQQSLRLHFGASDDGQRPPETPKKDYLSIRYNSAHYFPIARHTLYVKLNSGMHFGHNYPFLDQFLIGGSNLVTRNQILFPGFRVNGLTSSSAAAAQLGLTFNITPKFSISTGTSGLLIDIISTNYEIPDQTKSPIAGFNLTAAYDTFIGPIEIALMYNTINHKLITVFNLGYSMNFSE